MSAPVLTVNAGSSSIKVALYAGGEDAPLADALAERLGEEGARLRLRDRAGQDLPTAALESGDHAGAMRAILASLAQNFPDVTPRAIGHRVVHGGPNHARPQRVTDELMAELEALAPFAPLHQPHNLSGIRAAQAAFPSVPQIACFDTAFHRGHPWVADTFGLPRALYDEGVRRYGFHGLSYDYITGVLAAEHPELAAGRVAIAHLGNGASMCAVAQGKSVASSMGFSALDGLPMGTRCGQLDPGVLLYLMDQRGMGADEISHLLYSESGLKGLSGISNDMRTLEASDDPRAKEAIAYFVFRIQREIGALAACMGGIDALVFCGGIGENAAAIRQQICAKTGWMGLEIDPARNAAHERDISAKGAAARVLVIPTDEGLVIARAARAALTGA